MFFSLSYGIYTLVNTFYTTKHNCHAVCEWTCEYRLFPPARDMDLTTYLLEISKTRVKISR